MLGVMAVLFTACAASFSSYAADDKHSPPRLDGYSNQYTLLQPVRTARLTPFRAADGETVDLSRFRGKVVLLNFWATWCAPCIYEMPSLDRLAAGMSGDEFAVVPIAIDEKGLAAVAPFYRDHGLDNLDIYLDPEQRTAYRYADNANDAEFALYGLPISYIVDHEGRVMGYIAGAVDWQSDAAKALIRYYTGRIGS
jgi:thiol-disulfide isomerase/thioredoxin